MRNTFIIFAIMVIVSGCASVNSISVTSIPARRTNKVSAEVSRWVILGLNFDNDYVDEVSNNLSQKCSTGKISGILTKDEVYYYFLFFVLKKHVTVSGYCDSTSTASYKPQRQSRSEAQE